MPKGIDARGHQELSGDRYRYGPSLSLSLHLRFPDSTAPIELHLSGERRHADATSRPARSTAVPTVGGDA